MGCRCHCAEGLACNVLKRQSRVAIIGRFARKFGVVIHIAIVWMLIIEIRNREDGCIHKRVYGIVGVTMVSVVGSISGNVVGRLVKIIRGEDSVESLHLSIIQTTRAITVITRMEIRSTEQLPK